MYLEAGRNYREKWFAIFTVTKGGYLKAIPLGLRFHPKSIAHSTRVAISKSDLYYNLLLYLSTVPEL